MSHKLKNPLLFLILIVSAFYYKFILFGKIPFPGDLMVTAYSPWFDYNHFPSLNPIISDVFSQFFLWKYLSVDIIKSGQFPLWNPYSFTGTPLLATYHSATLYPLNLLLFFLKPYSWGLFILSSSIVSALTFYLFISIYVKSSAAKISGALIFTFSSIMTTWTEFGTAVHSMAWLPLDLYLIHKFIETSKYRFLLVLPLSLSAGILAGNLQVTTYTLFICLLYSLLLTQNIKKLLFTGLFVSLAFGITALQILPSYDLLKESIRGTDSYIQDNNYGLLPANKALEFFSADFYGNPSTRNYWGFLNYSESSNYLSIITLPCLIFSIFYLKNSKIKLFSWGLLILSLILLLDNPLSLFIYKTQIPILTQSYAVRILFVTIFSAALLTALSLDNFSAKKDKFLKSLIISCALLGGIIVGVYITKTTIHQIIITSPDKIHTSYYLNDQFYKEENLIIALKNTLIPIALLFATGSCFYLSRFKKISLILPLILILIPTIDLGRYFLKFNPFVDQKLVYPTTPSIEFLQKQSGFFRITREHAEVLPPNTWIAYNLYSPEGYDPLYLNEYGKFMHKINTNPNNEGSSGRYAEISNYSSPLINMTNTKYFIAILRDKNGLIPGNLINFQLQEAGFKEVFRDRSSVILENPNALPRAYFQNKSGTADITFYSPNRVTVKTNSNSTDNLILTDQYEKGWEAKIDNQSTPIKTASFIFRQVAIPPGDHLITFTYSPQSFNLGLKISLISLLVLFIVSTFTIYKKIF